VIVFDLRCSAQHRFEGWFRSAEDFDEQHARGLLQCPVCGGHEVEKLLSAPRLNLGAEGPRAAEAAGSPAEPKPRASEGEQRMLQAQAEFYRRLAEMLERSEDVGERFPEEARRIHYDKAPARRIHGEASAEETLDLLDEGIGVVPLPFRPKRKQELN
jgi:hypothetical protein